MQVDFIDESNYQVWTMASLLGRTRFDDTNCCNLDEIYRWREAASGRASRTPRESLHSSHRADNHAIYDSRLTYYPAKLEVMYNTYTRESLFWAAHVNTSWYISAKWTRYLWYVREDLGIAIRHFRAQRPIALEVNWYEALYNPLYALNKQHFNSFIPVP